MYTYIPSYYSRSHSNTHIDFGINLMYLSILPDRYTGRHFVLYIAWCYTDRWIVYIPTDDWSYNQYNPTTKEHPTKERFAHKFGNVRMHTVYYDSLAINIKYVLVVHRRFPNRHRQINNNLLLAQVYTLCAIYYLTLHQSRYWNIIIVLLGF